MHHRITHIRKLGTWNYLETPIPTPPNGAAEEKGKKQHPKKKNRPNSQCSGRSPHPRRLHPRSLNTATHTHTDTRTQHHSSKRGPRARTESVVVDPAPAGAASAAVVGGGRAGGGQCLARLRWRWRWREGEGRGERVEGGREGDEIFCGSRAVVLLSARLVPIPPRFIPTPRGAVSPCVALRCVARRLLVSSRLVSPLSRLAAISRRGSGRGGGGGGRIWGWISASGFLLGSLDGSAPSPASVSLQCLSRVILSCGLLDANEMGLQ